MAHPDLPPNPGSDLPRLEIRPRNVGRMIGVGLFSLVCVLAGLGMLFADAWSTKAAGALAIVFGVLGFVALPRMNGRKVPLVLDSSQLELRYPQGSAYLPWADVEAIGPSGVRESPVGLRLHSRERLIAGMDRSLARSAERAMRVAGPVMGAASAAQQADRGEDPADPNSQPPVDPDLRQVTGWESGLAWARERTGFDILLGGAELDRSPEAMIALLERYRAAATPGA